jgi:hypothetical protein
MINDVQFFFYYKNGLENQIDNFSLGEMDGQR